MTFTREPLNSRLDITATKHHQGKTAEVLFLPLLGWFTNDDGTIEPVALIDGMALTVDDFQEHRGGNWDFAITDDGAPT